MDLLDFYGTYIKDLTTTASASDKDIQEILSAQRNELDSIPTAGGKQDDLLSLTEELTKMEKVMTSYEGVLKGQSDAISGEDSPLAILSKDIKVCQNCMRQLIQEVGGSRRFPFSVIVSKINPELTKTKQTTDQIKIFKNIYLEVVSRYLDSWRYFTKVILTDEQPAENTEIVNMTKIKLAEIKSRKESEGVPTREFIVSIEQIITDFRALAINNKVANYLDDDKNGSQLQFECNSRMAIWDDIASACHSHMNKLLAQKTGH
ncbi:MAG: hypothetical protein WCF65_00280 [Parachlamydiaceae bacterium]